MSETREGRGILSCPGNTQCSFFCQKGGGSKCRSRTPWRRRNGKKDGWLDADRSISTCWVRVAVSVNRQMNLKSTTPTQLLRKHTESGLGGTTVSFQNSGSALFCVAPVTPIIILLSEDHASITGIPCIDWVAVVKFAGLIMRESMQDIDSPSSPPSKSIACAISIEGQCED